MSAPVLSGTEELMEFATLVPAKAKKRNMKVPANSPIIAMKWLRAALGRKLRYGNRLEIFDAVSSVVLILRFRPGTANPP